MFYNVRLKNLNDYVRYGLRIKNAYQNLNIKLGNDFIQSQKLITEIKEKGSAILVLKVLINLLLHLPIQVVIELM